MEKQWATNNLYLFRCNIQIHINLSFSYYYAVWELFYTVGTDRGLVKGPLDP